MAKKQDLVSIVVPVYNVERFLRTCLDSIIGQTYSKLEIILVDDGSTDSSLNICHEYEKKDYRVHVFHQENRGCASARNFGLEHAGGEYISFFDSDDVMHSGMIENMVAVMENENADMVFGNYNVISEDGAFLRTVQVNSLYETDSPLFTQCSIEPFPGNKLYRLSILKKIGITWKKVSMGEDLTFYLCALLGCKKISRIDRPLFAYRIVNNSLSRKYDLKILGIKSAFLEVESFYAKKKKIELFLKYIEPLKIAHYYYQFSKIKFYKKEDREKINLFFKKEMKVLKKYKSKSLYIRNLYLKYQIKSIYYTWI